MRQRKVIQLRRRRFFCKRFTTATLVALVVLCVAPAAKFQTASTPTSKPANPAVSDPSGSQAESQYVIGVGDVLDIRVLGRPQLTRDAVRVDTRGLIRMPLIEDEIQASCRTEAGLAADIATRYLKYVRRPQVDVFIREYNSQLVAVVGAIGKPGRFQLQRPVRLLELLTLAGGPTDHAGRTVQIVHAQTQSSCNSETTRVEGGELVGYALTDVLAGREQANPYLLPGDVISVLEAEQVFVVGNVMRPSSLPLKEPLTVSRAIAMSGGLLPYSKSDRVRIIRQSPDSTTKTELFVDLKAIEKRRAEDIALQANDIIDVPVSGSKRFLGSLFGSVIPAVTQMPVRAIP